MHIGIDVSALETGHAGRGTGTYTKELLKALHEIPSLTISEFIHTRSIPHDVDVLHYPYFDPFFLTLPAPGHIPVIVTVHDLIPLVYSHHFPSGLRGRIKWLLQQRKLRHTTAIITDSIASQQDIARLIPYPKERIYPIYLAPGKKFVPQSETVTHDMKKKYNLPEKFLLYVGDVNWNKNISGLIQAMEGLNIPLVLVGKAFLRDDLPEVQQINQEIKKRGLDSLVIKTGFIADGDLPAIYSSATVYIQISYAEGFGLPVLEAMACGTPCVVSSNSSLGEIAGPSVTVDPSDTQSITKGIQQALSLDRKQENKKLREWVEHFTWRKTALETSVVYKQAVGNHK